MADDRVDLFTEIRGNYVFRELDDHEVTVLAGLSEVCCMKANETFIREGEKDHCLYIVRSGQIEILKKSVDSDDDHCLAVLGSGNCIGEMSLVELDSHRSASAKTREDSIVIKIDFDKVIHNPTYKLHHYKLLSGIAKDLSNKLSHTNDVTVKAMKNELEVSKARVAMGLFTVNLLFALSIYTLTLRTLAEVIQMSGNYVTIITGIIIFFSLFMLVLIRKSGYPLKTFGLTTANWKKVVIDSIVFSVPVLVLTVIAKWMVVSMVTGYRYEPLFILTSAIMGKKGFNYLNYFLGIGSYVILCPVQEFIARGGIQSSLQNFLPDTRRKIVISIVLSNLLFAMAHSHFNFFYVLMTFIPGLFWGWLYYRQKSLIGVTVSHIFIGTWAIFIVGFPYMPV